MKIYLNLGKSRYPMMILFENLPICKLMKIQGLSKRVYVKIFKDIVRRLHK